MNKVTITVFGPKCNMAVAGGYFKDRLWVIQSFWSILYRKITWYHLNFAIGTLVIYGHRLIIEYREPNTDV